MKYITIQSMTTTKTADIEATVAQIESLESIGCDIIRVAVPDIESADAISKIKENISIPLVACIHFDHRLALRAIDAGADKIRINPGNIGGSENEKAVAATCKKKNNPRRNGVNSRSLEKEILKKHGGVTAEAMVESALGHVKMLNNFDFDNIWLSAKVSSVPLTVKTYRLLHEQTDYPLHLGVTEAGTEYNGIIKSSIGIGALLLDGIGDTIRVSLTAEPEKEIEAAKAILKALNLRSGIDIISCPTCGRCNVDIIGMTKEVEKRLENQENRNILKDGAFLSHRDVYNETIPTNHVQQNLTIAIMGCAVNGPGEAKQADYGIAGGNGEGIIFAKGEIIKKVTMDKLVDELFSIISKEVKK